MKFFLDSANIGEISTAHEWGIIDGVTTNPSLISKENREFRSLIQEIAGIQDGPVSVEVIGTRTDEMVREAVEFAGWSENIVIKIPMTTEGLRAVRRLGAEGIKTNMTLVFSVNQALLAAKVGANYISPFIGRIDDIGYDGMQVVRDTVGMIHTYGYHSEVIVSSIRHPLHIIEAVRAGGQVATIPFAVIEKIVRHPLTDIGLQKFLEDWEKVERA